jgi:SAM-dependent methyltransferase
MLSGIRRQSAAYFDSGRQIWMTVRQILSWRFGSPRACGRFLDFASGYGRLTRHIVAELPKESVWVSDIYAEGVAFQERTFGVKGIVSRSDPKDLGFETTFDCILVSSLFTHLPAARFSGWLRRLGAALSPGGTERVAGP